MPTASFRFPGVLNSQEILVAEAIQARAMEMLRAEGALATGDADAAKARLGGIVVRLMSDGTRSVGDLSVAAVRAYKGTH